MKLHTRTDYSTGKQDTYRTPGTRRSDRNADLRNTIYGALGLVLLVASALLLWGGMSR
jgi:hypothetical protein